MKNTAKILWIVFLLIAGFILYDRISEKMEVTEVGELVNAPKSQIEKTLGITFTSCPEMAESVYEYSKSDKVRVEGNTGAGVGVVYIGGSRCGFRIESKDYKMFDITIGKSRVGSGSKMTYPYEDSFEVDEGFDRDMSSTKTDFPVFYYNRANNDCVVLSCEKSTGNIVAVTYFNDFKKVTEELQF